MPAREWRDRNESKNCKVCCMEPQSLQSEGSSDVERQGALWGHRDKRIGLHNEVRRVKQHKRVATESKCVGYGFREYECPGHSFSLPKSTLHAFHLVVCRLHHLSRGWPLLSWPLFELAQLHLLPQVLSFFPVRGPVAFIDLLGLCGVVRTAVALATVCVDF